ncbi:ABC transporter substrate-binding protein [Kiloniella sp. b19]|uniref:ABC transporter substrate-binding protein n=1 Tax=Kiloniella sp. GXU_MW_B19 TaxID=3141326 RepID=UPI0031D26E24
MIFSFKNCSKTTIGTVFLSSLLLPCASLADAVIYESPAYESFNVTEMQETPMLKSKVASGDVLPVQERIPQTPFIVKPDGQWQTGKQGGAIRTLISRSKDVRLMGVYGYARLIGYDSNLDLQVDILERLEVEDQKTFTLTLRKGHRWSDGAPFTTEDFRFYWEDVVGNEDLSPLGVPADLLVNGKPPSVEILDEQRIRYSWADPNPYFLLRLAGTRPAFIYQPAHYMKQFHAGFVKPVELGKRVEENGARNWVQLFNRKARQYKFTNPALPTLQPWINTVEPPSTRFVGVRNPYYHRVDEKGQQLPYADQFILNLSGAGLIPAKTGAGETDLQSRGLGFSDYTYLKENDDRFGYNVHLWKTIRGSQFALYPNLNVQDPVWSGLVRDVRFRRALSLAVHRRELNQVLYYGLGQEGNNLILPESPFYSEDLQKRWATYDIEKANNLLNELGLINRNEDGIRMLPDGRLAEIIVETAGESTDETDILELISDSMAKVGLKVYSKPSSREVLRNRIFAGETVVSLWYGYENSLITPNTPPLEYTPRQQQSFHWPMWGQYVETKGSAGRPADLPEAQRLEELYHAWSRSKSKEQKEEIWREILEIQADQVYTIGLVAQIPQPVVSAGNLMNVPDKAFYNWEPGAQFGIYRPDGFWLNGN